MDFSFEISRLDFIDTNCIHWVFYSVLFLLGNVLDYSSLRFLHFQLIVQFGDVLHQGLVVQIIFSLTKLLVKNSLGLLLHINHVH